ncbi:NYN domain-containing protein [Permianibacter aggregans]|uniref:NYN domain-containing protein n=1 Tax=Permianibacter aggregans TaxID=1510150 RepID=A0A4R6U634_9GAMM|nr:NYN domain-containing protein [Permianibacter aggregans]TDQ41960.1 NYN domain-containing protein [Permianibacter aggregans]
MQRVAFFVDGSNLFGSLKSMNLEVENYEALYEYVYKESVETWRSSTHVAEGVPTQLRRVYWYVVGAIDQWDLSLPQSQTALRRGFDQDREVKNQWLATVGKTDPTLKGDALINKAWTECFTDFKSWYDGKCNILDGMKSFHQGVRMGTDLIEMIECGHWKVNFIKKYVEEKGLDTSLAVDMLAQSENYDIAMVASGDADSIPSIQYMKSHGKHVGVIEFINGTPPESKGRGFSSRLKQHADFVVRIYETELIRRKLATRPNGK